MSVLQEIKEKIKNKQINSLVTKLEKKFSVNSFDSLGNLQELAYWLFVFSKDDLSEQVCDIIETEHFKGNIELWSPIEYIKSLKCKFLLKKGKVEETKTIADEIAIVNKNSKGFIRRLNGSLLPTEEINCALKENNVKRVINYTFSQIPDLVLIEIMGGSEKIPKEKAQEMINNSIDYILKNIDA